MSDDLLTALLTELRLELAGETPIALHPGARSRGQRSTKRYEREDDGSGPSVGGGTWLREPTAGYGTRVGLPFTPGFERRLSHRDWWGINELAEASVGEIGDWCRSRHQSDLHRCPGRSTSLCERIVAALATYGQPIGQVAWREQIDPELVEDLAVKALRHARTWRHRKLHMYMRAARENERDLAVRCPQCNGELFVTRRRPAA